MSEFKTFNPFVNLAYFGFAATFAMILKNPVCIIIGLVLSLSYSVMLGGAKTLKFNIFALLPLAVFGAVLNPLISHKGATILCYLPSGNPLTKESVIYGAAASGMIWCVVCLFSSFNKIMTSDKLMYAFGKIIPSLSLVFSMTLRFVPKFKERIKAAAEAQKGIGRAGTGGIIRRAKNGMKILSIVITESLEGSIDTADSMKGRGFGTGSRTSFSNISFDKRDAFWLVLLLLLAAAIIFFAASGAFYFRYFPDISKTPHTPQSAAAYFLYAIFCACPIIIEIKEGLRWKILKSKI